MKLIVFWISLQRTRSTGQKEVEQLHQEELDLDEIILQKMEVLYAVNSISNHNRFENLCAEKCQMHDKFLF